MPTALIALIIIFLFHAPLVLAASGDAADGGSQSAPLTPAPSTLRQAQGSGQALSLQGRGGEKAEGRGSSGAPAEACRGCEGLQYFSPMKKSEKAKILDPRSGSGMTEKSKDEKQDGAPLSSQGRGPSEGTSGGPAQLEREAASGRAHLSSDRRVNLARALVERNRFHEALEILKPLALQDRPDVTDVRFLLGLAASRRSQDRGVGDEERLQLLDLAIANFRTILIKRPELVRVRLELALAFYLKQDDQLAREHFERALVGKPPAALATNVNRFLNIIRARRRWTGYFGFSLAPDTNINAASDAAIIYINGLPFAGARTARLVRISVSWAGAAWNTSIPWPGSGDYAPGSTSTTGNTRVASSTRRSCRGSPGRAGC